MKKKNSASLGSDAMLPDTEILKALRKSMSNRRHSVHSVSWKWAYVFLAVGMAVYYMIYLLDYDLPKAVSVHDAEENPHLFSGERSRLSLKRITDLGQRVVGSVENEVLTPAIIMEELQEAKKYAHPSQELVFEVQKGSGAYNLMNKASPANVYHNITNVVAMLKGSSGEHGIMVNCHYDSVSSSVGASDDAINCAIMLEIVRVLSKADVRLRHNVVFLFNGAEESGLMGSHLFLQHEWSSSVRVFLNLEGAGIGGRSLLFQSGPRNYWLFHYYARYAPHPHGQILGEELFQNGFIPSDTDFRIFRDFGNFSGLDFAFARNGYVYHSIYDQEEYITPGSHQHMGDNILEVIRHLGFAPEMDNLDMEDSEGLVYFDYLGWYMIRYSAKAGVTFNIFVVIFSFLSVLLFIARLSGCSWLPDGVCPLNDLEVPLVLNEHVYKEKFDKFLDWSKDTTKEVSSSVDIEEEEEERKEFKQVHPVTELVISVVARIGGMVAAVVANATMGAFINAFAPLVMPFFSNSYLVFPLYWCPALAAYILVPMMVDNWRNRKSDLPLSLRAQLNLVAQQIPFALLLLFLTISGVRSAAVIMVVVLFSAVANILIHFTTMYRSVHSWVWVYLFVQIPSFLYQMYIVYIGYSLFLPIMGRSGVINADLYISIVSVIFLIYLLSFVLPLMTLVRRPWVVVVGLAFIALIMLPISINSPLGMPYKKGPSNPAPQRYWIMHSERTFLNESGDVRRHDYGYFILNFDPNSPRTIAPHLSVSIQPLADDCQREMFCGVPLYKTRMVSLSPKSSWLPSQTAPIQPVKTELKLVSRKCKHGVCSLLFNINGPDCLTVTFVPREGVVLSSWSHPAPALPIIEWNERPGYFMHIVRGEVGGSIKLELHFDVIGDTNSSLLDIGVAGNHIHHEEYRTPEFVQFIQSFPDYVTMIGWISSYTAYVF